MTELVWLDIGRAAYPPTLDRQLRLRDEVEAAGGERAYLVLVEHDPPVITFGRRIRREHLVASPDRLAELGIERYDASRGGDVTYHGPGQLVGYLILQLDPRRQPLHGFIRDLEEVVIRLLGRFGVTGERVNGLTGVWVGREKVAAIGVAVRRWVTYHGLALNVCPDLSHFDLIVPCGIRGRGVTSLARLLNRPVTVDEVKPLLIELVKEVYGFERAREGAADAGPTREG